MSLQDKLDVIAAESKKRFPEDALRVLAEFRKELSDSGLKERIPGENSLLPPFDLEDEEGRSVSSEDFLVKGPMVLTFYRGRW